MCAIIPEVIPLLQIASEHCEVHSPGDTVPAMEKQIHAVRRLELEKLVDGKFAGNQSKFAMAVGTVPPHINQILRGKKRMGEGLARRIELALNLPAYQMDGGPQAALPAPDVPFRASYLNLEPKLVPYRDRITRRVEPSQHVFRKEMLSAVIDGIADVVAMRVSVEDIRLDGRLMTWLGPVTCDLVTPQFALDLFPDSVVHDRMIATCTKLRESSSPLNYFIVYWLRLPPSDDSDDYEVQTMRRGRERAETILGALRSRGLLAGYLILEADLSNLYAGISEMLP